jgi:hypothetical protein
MSGQEETATGNGPVTVPSLTGGPPQHEGKGSVAFPLATSSPGLYMTEDHRYWVNGKGPYPSVTTILDVLHKEPLIEWMKNQIALSAMLHLHELIGKTAEEGIAYLRSFPDKIRDDTGKLGSDIHLLAHMEGLGLEGSVSDSKGFEVSPDTFPYLEAFRGFLAFLEAQGGKIISSEHAVYSETEGYCGTYDLIVSLWDELWLLDIKSGRGYYADFGLQLAGYANAEYIVLPNDPTLYPMPQVQHTAVLHIRPDQYQSDPPSGQWRLVEYPTTDRDYLAFLAALELWKWKSEGRFTKSSLNKAIVKEDPRTQVPDA